MNAETVRCRPWREQFREQVEHARRDIKDERLGRSEPFDVTIDGEADYEAASETIDLMVLGHCNHEPIEGVDPGHILLTGGHIHSSGRCSAGLSVRLDRPWNHFVGPDGSPVPLIDSSGRTIYPPADLAGLLDRLYHRPDEP